MHVGIYASLHGSIHPLRNANNRGERVTSFTTVMDFLDKGLSYNVPTDNNLII